MSARARALLLPGVFALAGIAVLLILGFWQLERRIWKETLIARVEARIHAPTMPLPPESDWNQVSAERDEYRRVTAEGQFRHDREALVYTVEPESPRRYGGPGYLVLTPLVLTDGSSVIINRGFVPLDRKDPATRRQGQVEGPVSVTGLLRLPEPAYWFTPANDPARDQWYRRDPAEIGAARGLARVAPFLIDADAAPNPGGLPQGGGTRVAFPNDHLQYALTWFGLALVLAIIFVLFARQRLQERG